MRITVSPGIMKKWGNLLSIFHEIKPPAKTIAVFIKLMDKDPPQFPLTRGSHVSDVFAIRLNAINLLVSHIPLIITPLKYLQEKILQVPLFKGDLGGSLLVKLLSI
jgi:hypothetical protein